MAESWHPEREVEIIAGTPPGGGLDRCARALAKALEGARLAEHLARGRAEMAAMLKDLGLLA